MLNRPVFVRCVATLIPFFACTCFSLTQDSPRPSEGYVFQREKKRVLFRRDEYFYEGYLNEGGGFVPDPNAPPIKCDVPSEGVREWIDELQKRKSPVYNYGPWVVRANDVYQYLSGDWLIPGSLGGDGDFFPHMENGNGNRNIPVITMEKYLVNYDPAISHPIYNLPGKIVPKKSKGPQGVKKK